MTLLVGATVAHRFSGMPTPFFVLLGLVSSALALLAALLAALGLLSLWMRGARGGMDALRGLVFAALPLVLFGVALERYLTTPELYEVTTDMATPPDWLKPVAADQIWLARPPVSDKDRESQAEAYPQLTGRRYEGAIDRVLDGVKKIARQTGLRITKVDGDPGFSEADPAKPPRTPAQPAPDPRQPVPDAPDAVPVPLPRPFDDEVAKLIRRANGVTLQGTKRSLVLGLTFDVVIRLREEAETTFVDIRVASRYGPHDLGFSAEVAQDFLTGLDAELLGIAGD